MKMTVEKRKYFRLLYKDEAIKLLDKKAEFTGLISPLLRNLEIDSLSLPRPSE